MATQFAPITPSKLRDELLTHPLLLCIGSFGLSTFMSHAIYDVFDWRPVAICVASDILAIGMDHYFDQEPMQMYALKTGNSEITAIFKQAKVLLLSNAALLLFTLALCPPWTTLMVIIFFGPAFIWDFKLLIFGGKGSQKKTKQSNEKPGKKFLSVKRIPGMKALLTGIIRGCGTFAVVNAVLARAHPVVSNGPGGMWNPTQILIWSTINRTCHAVMADVRDFDADYENQVPTIPVLLKSVFWTKVLLTALHIFTIFLYSYNPYIVFASLYSTVLTWYLNHTTTPRGLYRLSFHTQTVTAALYGAKLEIDNFSGYRIYPSRGRLFVRGDSKIFRFANSKNESLFLQRKNPRKIAWTQVYRRMHKKGITEEVAKKRSRRTVKHQRGIVGADLAAIAARRNQTAAVRAQQRTTAIQKAKAEKKAKEDKKEKAPKPARTHASTAPRVSKQQMKGGKGGR
ncbi:hypothetical protein L226DRAFT_543270 [Lentinus tigrinus ALCF2SS1-7]|uniref:Large ribosomal subunit protein eL24-related N-terminal domain-containing protein n=1 Tax=Lentinus tigrinus ALCF2SS1-6 TaxID=1328759 RepID=A0A5C2SQ70_9APHY|nr:hypothetical protein L227DRAFT_493912 [Lentinus tigrinus ALCF2SS1-6]RPD79105.1 hypothetical protein L226DRAFT_543270 [Lentinus tigrinus ALCF2SS1-7]